MRLYEIFERPVMNAKRAAEILGVPMLADEERIKLAYRKLAARYHPDRPGGHEEIFKDIAAAYKFLLRHNQGVKRVEPKPLPPAGMTPEDEMKSMWWQRKATAPFQPMNWQRRP